MDKIKPRTFEELLEDIGKIIEKIEKEQHLSTCSNPRCHIPIFPFDAGFSDPADEWLNEPTKEIPLNEEGMPIEFECDSVSGNGECNPKTMNDLFCSCDEPIKAINYAGGFEFEFCRKCKKEIQ